MNPCWWSEVCPSIRLENVALKHFDISDFLIAICVDYTAENQMAICIVDIIVCKAAL